MKISEQYLEYYANYSILNWKCQNRKLQKLPLLFVASCLRMIYLKNGKFATLIYNLSFELKLLYFKCSKAVVSEKSHALLANIQSKFLI